MGEPLLPTSAGVVRPDRMIAITDVGQNWREPPAEARRERLEFHAHLIGVVHRGIEAPDAKEIVDERGAIA